MPILKYLNNSIIKVLYQYEDLLIKHFKFGVQSAMMD